MEQKIKARDLKVGMYVILPTSWFRHPFMKNRFNITSEDEIRTIIKWGMKEVLIDPSLEKSATATRTDTEAPIRRAPGAHPVHAGEAKGQASPHQGEPVPDMKVVPGKTTGAASPASLKAGDKEEPVTAVKPDKEAPARRDMGARPLHAGEAEKPVPPARSESAPYTIVVAGKTVEAASIFSSQKTDTASPVKEKTTDNNVPTRGDEVVILPHTWEPEKLVPPELREAIHDKKLPPEKKAAVVYTSSLKIMDKVLLEPTAENIQEMKEGIAEVVDLIISDDDTSKQLLSITSHDYYTYTHSVRVGVFSVMLAKSLYKDSYAHDLHELGAGFFLHDIGKVRINPDIINKPGKLTDAEWQEMRTHPFLGYKLLSEANQLTKESKIIVLQHHEWNNGKGYPNKLTGNEIHEYARICSIADVYDAITSDRPYKEKKMPFEALSIMKEETDSHFGKELFEKFVLLLL